MNQFAIWSRVFTKAIARWEGISPTPLYHSGEVKVLPLFASEETDTRQEKLVISDSE